ncbi:MAG: hypothetical protein IPP79_04965 [Chitinophagaceae bacterium]|nr:hypothetical protein [Chitinophagaceae bacterium]
MGFKSDEVNNFDFDVSLSNREYSPTGSGFYTVMNRGGNFFTGSGYTNKVFGPETEFAKSAMKSNSIDYARNFFYSKYKYLWKNANSPNDEAKSKSRFGLLAINGSAKATEIRGTWNLFDVIKTGFDNGENDWGMQYIGSSAISVFASYDANRLIFVVANSTSKWSYELHMSDAIPRKSSYGSVPRSTILNIIVWDEPINFDRFK